MRIVIKIIYVDASKLPMKTYSKVVTQHFGIILKKHEETIVEVGMLLIPKLPISGVWDILGHSCLFGSLIRYMTRNLQLI